LALDETVPLAEDKGVDLVELEVEVGVEVVVTAITVLWLMKVANVRAEVSEPKNRIVAALGQRAWQSFCKSSLRNCGYFEQMEQTKQRCEAKMRSKDAKQRCEAERSGINCSSFRSEATARIDKRLRERQYC